MRPTMPEALQVTITLALLVECEWRIKLAAGLDAFIGSARICASCCWSSTVDLYEHSDPTPVGLSACVARPTTPKALK